MGKTVRAFPLEAGQEEQVSPGVGEEVPTQAPEKPISRQCITVCDSPVCYSTAVEVEVVKVHQLYRYFRGLADKLLGIRNRTLRMHSFAGRDLCKRTV